MSEQIVNDTIQKSSEIISGVNSASTDSVNIWLWIALIELLFL